LEASVEGALAVDLETMLAEGAVRLDAPRLAAASGLAGMDLAGAARGEVRLDAPEDAQRVALDLTGEGIRSDGAAVETAALEAVLLDALGAPSATYSLRASGLSAEGARVAELELDGEAAGLTGAPSATAQGVLRGIEAPDGAATVETLRLDLSAEDLIEAPRGTLEAEAETLRAGGASVARLTVTAQGEDLTGAPRGSVQAEASGLRLAEGVTLQTLTLEAQGENLAEDPGGRAELVASGLAVEDTARLARVTLTAEGGARDLTLRLRGQGETEGGEPVSLAADAAGAVAGEAPVLRVSRLETAAGEAALRLRAPLALRRDGESWRAEGLDLALPGGSLRGAAALHPDGASGDLRLAIDDLAALAELAEAPVDSGRLDLSADFDTRPASPRAAIDLTGRDLVFSDIVAQDGALALDASGRWDGRAARLTGTLSGPFGRPFDLRATLPLVPSGGPLPRLPEDGALDAGVRWQGPVETIWPLLPLPDHDLRGELDLDLRATGALTDPRISGAVSLREGAYQNLQAGTILADMTVTSEIADGEDLVLRMEATDGAGAPVRADIRLEGRTLEATLTSEEAVLVRREDVTAAATLDLRAEGPLTAPLISGDIRVDRAEVRLVNATPPSLPTLDVVVKGAPPPPEPEAGEAGGPQLDIRVHAPGDIFVRGRGLVSEWEMDLQVAGSAAAPRITGAIERRRGQLDFLGRAFALAQGQVRFQGASPIDPYLDVSLEHQRQEITGRIAVRGPASDPEITFESEPALPEGEVLPRVIFGRSRQSLSSGEALQLGIGVATLLSGREGPLGGVRSAAGLDVLSVDTSGESATVRAGRNVAEGVFVGVEQPVEGGSSAVEVEVELRDNVTVDARTGGDKGSSVGVNWKYDF
ncbi:MAG: translocation/assembly module TamB domain-containing protein, partial [Pseudomonadota bacterium]